MKFKEFKDRMICICCKRVIARSKIFMIVKHCEMIDGQVNIEFKPMCKPCHSYTN